MQKEADQDLEEQLNVNKEVTEELANIAAALDKFDGQVADLRTGLAGLSTAQPWGEDLERLERGIGSAAKERALVVNNMEKLEHVADNLTRLLGKKKEELGHLKTEMEVLSNSSQSVASWILSRLDIMETSGQDDRLRQSILEKNMCSRIESLEYR